MISRRTLLVGLLATSLIAVVGTSGFSAVSADRPVQVSVVDDEDAYLAFPDEELQCGNPQDGSSNSSSQNSMAASNTVVRNQFGTGLDSVTLEVSVSSGKLRIGKGPKDVEQLESSHDSKVITYHNLAAGDAARLRVLPPRDRQNVTVASTVNVESIEAEGDGIAVSADKRTFDVDCG